MRAIKIIKSTAVGGQRLQLNNTYQVPVNVSVMDAQTLIGMGRAEEVIYRERKQHLIPFGDSHTAAMWRQVSLAGSITVSGDTATLTCSAAPLAPVGGKFRLAICDFAGYNDIHTITAVNSTTEFEFPAPVGAPASETVSSQVAYFENDQTFQINYIHALNGYSKHRFNIEWDGGVGGDSISDGLARVNDVIDQDPDRCIVMFGTNNAIVATAQDVTSEIADLKSICSSLLEVGVAVDLCTIPPFGSGYSGVSDVDKVGFMMELNRQIRDYAKSTAGINLHDVYAWVTDPAESNGQAKSDAMNTDGIHFNPSSPASGANLVGKGMADNYDSWLGSHEPTLPTSQADGWDFNSLSPNRWTNHFFQGTEAATSWNAAYTGTGNSQVRTCKNRTVLEDGDTLGKNQKCELTAVVNGTHLIHQNPTSRMTAGKTYKLAGSVTVDPDTLNYLTCELLAAFTVDGVQRQIKSGINKIHTAGNYVFETVPFIWPAGATSNLFYLQSKTNGAGSPVIELGRVALLGAH